MLGTQISDLPDDTIHCRLPRRYTQGSNGFGSAHAQCRRHVHLHCSRRQLQLCTDTFTYTCPTTQATGTPIRPPSRSPSMRRQGCTRWPPMTRASPTDEGDTATQADLDNVRQPARQRYGPRPGDTLRSRSTRSRSPVPASVLFTLQQRRHVHATRHNANYNFAPIPSPTTVERRQRATPTRLLSRSPSRPSTTRRKSPLAESLTVSVGRERLARRITMPLAACSTC